MKLNTTINKPTKGFSVVEVAVALGVVTLMLTTFLGIFGPAQKSVQTALSAKDANAMKDAVSNEFAILREEDRNNGSVTSFDKAVTYITESHAKNTTVLVYRYKAVPQDDDGDGILEPFTNNDGIPGRDFIVVTAVRKIDTQETRIRSELSPQTVDGPVFAVRMTQLIDDSNDPGNFILSQSVDSLLDPIDGSVVASSSDYDEAVIAFRAEFYKLPVNLAEFVFSDNWQFDFTGGNSESSIGAPVVSANLAARR